MSDRISREQARRLVLFAYELGWRNACDDHLMQQRDPSHPIGAGRRRDADAVVDELDPYNVLNLDGRASS